MAADPIKGILTRPSTLSQYSYVVNNPLKYVDLTGLSHSSMTVFTNGAGVSSPPPPPLEWWKASAGPNPPGDPIKSVQTTKGSGIGATTLITGGTAKGANTGAVFSYIGIPPNSAEIPTSGPALGYDFKLVCDVFWNDSDFWEYDIRGFQWYRDSEKRNLAVAMLMAELELEGAKSIFEIDGNFRKMQLLQYLSNTTATGQLNVDTLFALTNSIFAVTHDNSFDNDRMIDASQLNALAEWQNAHPAWSNTLDKYLDAFGIADIVTGVAFYMIITSQQEATTQPRPATGNNSGTANSSTGNNVQFGSAAKSATKLSNQMSQRRWTESTVRNTVSNPFTTRASTNLATGNSATVYYNQRGGYVIVDNVTNVVVQVSDNLYPSSWIPDPNIINPFIP